MCSEKDMRVFNLVGFKMEALQLKDQQIVSQSRFGTFFFTDGLEKPKILVTH